MNANELMIGDWLLFYDEDESQNIPVKIVGIDDDGWVFYEFPDGIKEEGWCKKLYFIPLTKEILEKNGFTDGEYRNYCGFVWKYKADGFQKIGFTIQEKQGIIWGEKIKKEYPNAIGDKFSIPGIRYLHELQHALRLCGIDKEIVV